jgi:hypothetical protein
VHCAAEEAVLYPAVAEAVEQHMSEHAIDEHDSLKLFSSDLEGMTFGDQAYEDKMHQLMEVRQPQALLLCCTASTTPYCTCLP